MFYTIKNITDTVLDKIKASISSLLISKIIHLYKDPNKDNAILSELKITSKFFDQFYKSSSYLCNLKKGRRDLERIVDAIEFHKEWLCQKNITISGPNKQSVHCNRSFYFDLKKYHCLIYHFQDESPFYLIIGDYWQEVIGVYFPNTKVIIFSRPPIFNEQVFAFDLIKECTRWSFINKKSTSLPKAIMCYHSHFAHHLWNELSGIDHLVNNLSKSPIKSVFIESEPFGRLSEMYPELKSSNIEIHRKNLNKSKFSIGKNNIIIPTSPVRLSNSVTERIRKLSYKLTDNHILTQINIAKANYKHIIWITIRTKNRTFEINDDGFINFLHRLDKDIANTLVVFDGFSQPFQVDKGTNKVFQQNISQEKREIDQFINSQYFKTLQITNLTGKSLNESICWGQLAQFYICHLGSLHHKLHWIYDIPGIIHAETSTLSKGISLLPGLTEKENKHKPIIIKGLQVINKKAAKDKRGRKMKANLGFYNLDWNKIAEEAISNITSR